MNVSPGLPVTLVSMRVLSSPAALRSVPVDGASATELLEAAGRGSSEAWKAIVDRYERLIWSVARSFRYDDATTADAVQTVWLRLAEHFDRIRDPEQLPAWLATTCRNECYAAGRRRSREAVDTSAVASRVDHLRISLAPVDEDMLERETLTETLAAFRQLPEDCQQLLRLVCTDPPLGYEMVSELTGRPIGSIGPTRRRCLDKLRGILERGRV